MNTEYELRVLEIDKDSIIKKLEKLNANFCKEYNFKRYVYDIDPLKKGEWIRLRSDGYETTLTYKRIDNEDNIEGTKEVEVLVDNIENTNIILNKMGYVAKAYQENKRIKYMIRNVEICIDSWPLIPTYLEIEGPSETEVMNVLKLLDISKDAITFLGCDSIYKKIYNIDLSDIKNLVF